MIDLHCHLLPGIDDGPETMVEAVAMARVAVAAGTRTIATTPHIDHQHGVSPREVAAHVEGLRRELDEAGVDLEVVPGGEIALSRALDLDDAELDALHLGGGPFVLLEAPLVPVGADTVERVVAALQRRGHEVLLAHPERSPVFQREPAALARLVERDALAQVTAGALGGQFGSTVRRHALAFVESALVQVIASDGHSPHRRPPDLLAGTVEAEEESPALTARREWLVHGVPSAVLSGDDVPEPPAAPRRKRRWSLSRR